MPITRDQASRVLTQPEMGLFGDSRNPALRALSEKALASRVERTRKLRDKSRDLLQRQKLKSRERTGSKLGTSGIANQRTGKKGEILDDVLQRFERRLQEVQAAAEPAVLTAGKRKANVTERKTGSDSKTTRTPKATTRQPAAKPAASTRSAASAKPRTAAGASVKPKTTRARSKAAITPERALANTHKLLEAKQQRDRQPPPYLAIDTHSGTEQTSPGFQSGTARSKALELHEGEMRMEPIHGSISTHDRRNQGQRDKS